MKSVLMALSPYWYYLIGEGIKTEEVRKTIPRALDWNKQVECYMTKDEKSFKRIPKEFQEKYRAHFGKVGMRFTNNAISIRPANMIYLPKAQKVYLKLLKSACLTELEAIDYMGGQLNRDMYFLHISDLVIYDKPRELGEFWVRSNHPDCDQCAHVPVDMSPDEFVWHNDFCGECHRLSYKSMWATHFRKRITRAPQSWMYCQSIEAN